MKPPDQHLVRPRGRPTKLTDEVAVTIVKAMSRGYFMETAAYLAEVSPRTVQMWMAKGRKACGRGAYGRFYAEVKRAIAQCQGNMHDSLVRKGKKDWSALVWLMERRFPRQYGRKKVVRTDDIGPAREPMTMEQLIRRAERIEAAERAKDSSIGQLNRSELPDVP